MKRKTTSVHVVRKTTSRQYLSWIAELKKRYRATQIKAAIAVNSALIEFYWNLGKDISEKSPGEIYGGKFFEKLSTDLRQVMPDAGGFAKANLIYCLKFYELYNVKEIVPQVVEQLFDCYGRAEDRGVIEITLKTSQTLLQKMV